MLKPVVRYIIHVQKETAGDREGQTGSTEKED